MLKRKRTRRVRRQRGGDGSSAMPDDYPGALIQARENPMDIDSLQVPQRLDDFIEKSDASMDTTA